MPSRQISGLGTIAGNVYSLRIHDGGPNLFCLWGHDYGGLLDTDIRDINPKSPATKSMKYNPNYGKDFKRLLTACTSLPETKNIGNYGLLRRVDDCFLSLPLQLIEEVVSHLPIEDVLSLCCASTAFVALYHSKRFWNIRLKSNDDCRFFIEMLKGQVPQDCRVLYNLTRNAFLFH